MNFLPISINVENKNILVIGGGKVATQKIKNIMQYCKNITVVAPEISNDILSNSGIKPIKDVYSKKHLKGMFMVYACTDIPEINEQILADAEKANILCNRADKADESHFHSSGIVETKDYVLGINSRQKEPKKLLQMKKELTAFVEEKEELFNNKPEYKGCVFLVGFGPGNPELITKRGEHLLSIADVIFYDDLLDANALSRYPAEKIYVGKRRDNHSKDQDEINEVLYKAAKKGNMVVRLKGGDPLIFGRGSEERFYLEQRGIDVEIVPGISSAIAAASYANIPLTHRGISSSVAFGTAHGKNSFKILESDTSVYYMGAKNIVQIAQKYLEMGYPENFPVGLVHNVSMPGQKVIKTCIKDVANGVHEIESPVISIFGNTVNYEAILKEKGKNKE